MTRLDQFEEEERHHRGRGKPEPASSYWRGTVRDRAMVARGYAPTVIKITSFSRGIKQVKKRFEYASMDYANPLETDQGSFIEGAEEFAQVIQDWALDFTDRENGRDVMSLMPSTPRGVNQAAAKRGMRAFLAEEFGSNFSYVFGCHDDTDNYHGHAVIKMVGRDGTRLNPRKADLQRWRERYASHLRERGIRVESSPRKARGQGRKAVSTALHKVIKRGADHFRKATIGRTIAAEIKSGKTLPDDMERRQLYRNAEERVAYAQAAIKVLQPATGPNMPDKDKVAAIRHGAELARLALILPVPRTLRREIIDTDFAKSGKLKPRSILGAKETNRLLAGAHKSMNALAKTIRDPKLRTQAKSSISLISAKQNKLSRERAADRDFDLEL